MNYPSGPRTIRAPRGTVLNCRGWVQEAAYRMIQNNLDPEVAEKPEDLVVYGGTGKAARDWKSLDRILACLRELGEDQTLLVQSGKPVGVLRSHPEAPRVLIANANLVGRWANWDYFRELEQKGLIMFGQMTAGSWIYIGSQGIVQGTYETYLSLASRHFGGSLKSRLNITAGLGGMGGAQPLAITMNGGVCLAAEIDEDRILRRLESGYLDRMTRDMQEGIDWALEAKRQGAALSIGICCNAVDLLEGLIARSIIPDTLTDQTSAHDPLMGYYPQGYSLIQARELRLKEPETYQTLAMNSMARQVNLMLQLKERGAITFDYGNNIRAQALAAGEVRAFDIPGFVPEYIRPLFCEGKGPFRWVALSGDPEDIYTTDRELKKLFPANEGLKRWLDLAAEKIRFQGLPARICWLGLGEREQAGLLFNELVRSGKVRAPIVIGRDHLDAGSVASPNRETEGMADGSDAIADWPVLNALINTAAGASWVSFHHGGGVGIGYSLHAGLVIVADGSPQAARRLSRVLFDDPALGVIRHADAGYPLAEATAEKFGLIIP